MARWLLALAAVLGVWARPARAQVAQPPRCPSHTPQRCTLDGYGQNEYSYTVDGLKLLIEFTDSGYFTLKCPENLTLDNSALPRFEWQLRVNKVQLKDCPAPPVSYAASLDALNVLALDRLKLINAGNLTGAHLTGLTDVTALELIDAELAPRTLAAPQGLRRLLLDNVRLPPGELRHLPRSLELLDLTRMACDLPADVLERLPHLVNVSVRDTHNVSVALAGALRVLALDVPAARVPSALLLALRSLTVSGWDEPAPEPWTTCALRTLNLLYVTAAELPAGWLRACAELRVLRVRDGPRLSGLHGTSLRGARQLQELHITSCALTALPTGLLDDAKELRWLDLSGNFLKELPGGLFVKTSSLQKLDLTKNLLTTDVYTSLKAVTSLTTLKLSNNNLKDSCGGASDTVRGVSPLESLNKLTHLHLRKTNASLICRDWRENMPLLETLDLADNNFTSVTYADLQFRGAADVRVNLESNNVTRLQYTRHDYSLAVAGASASRAVVSLGAALACDCDTYWAARALRERPAHARLSAACARGPQLRAVPLESLRCGAPGLCAGSRCACAWRHSGAAAPARVLRVRCERVGLTRAADALAPLMAAARRNGVAPDDYDWQLHFAHNDIAELDAADFPKHLSLLDLRNNSLSSLSADAARALLADERRRVWLAHNPLDCGCGTAAARAALRERRAGLDYLACACADGTPLHAAPPAPCSPRAGALAAAAALAALLAGGGGALAALRRRRALAAPRRRPALRRLKAALRARGWLPRAAERDDGARRFDAFLSFSHGDERFVRDELVARLESGPAPYRLCVHYRDWAPGGWIPAQIAASVRASRRTVAVVSAHFLRSAWARAEFREAHALALRDARPRLVVVLLDDPAALPLDDKLRRYLATNTYVRWGDPWFWQKLRLALPRGRGPAGEQTGPALDVAGPALEGAGPALEVAGPALEGARPALEVAGPALEVAGPALEVAGPALEGAGPALEGAGPALDGAGPALEVAGPALEGARPALEVAGPALEVAGPALEVAGPALEGAGPALEGAGPALEGAGPVLEVPPEVCSEPSATSSLNTPDSASSSSASSSPPSSSSSTGSAMELDGLVSPPTSCGAHYAHAVASLAPARALPV